jgi:3-hydroxymyristoyl/3-hydroxydecanoyl-(acyl carrier protein) dehydratase
MRYRFVDEIVSLTLDGAPRIEVVKRFDAGDDVFSGPQGPERVPESMLLELMATTGGHLLFRHLGERRLPLLLKVPECRFEGWVPAGERLRAVAALRGVSSAADGTSVAEAETQVYVETSRVAHARIMFVCVSVPGIDLAGPGVGV